MLLKKMLLTLCFFYILTGSKSIFCMIKESTIPKKTIPQKLTLVDLWSKYFNENETFEKSFVFDTQKPEVKIIAIQTNKRTHFFNCGSKGLLILYIF